MKTENKKNLRDFLDDEINEKDIEEALKKGANTNVTGKTGAAVILGIGITAGWSIAGPIGALLGVNTFWGSTILAGLVGSVMIVDVPLALILFCIIILSSLAYSAIALIVNGTKVNMRARQRLKNFTDKEQK